MSTKKKEQWYDSELMLMDGFEKKGLNIFISRSGIGNPQLVHSTCVWINGKIGLPKGDNFQTKNFQTNSKLKNANLFVKIMVEFYPDPWAA